LRCIDANMTDEQWRACLVDVDRELMTMLDRADEDGVIIMSLPYAPHQIKEGMREFVGAIDEHAFSFCCDAVIEFLLPTNQALLMSNALLIINSTNGHSVSLPRNIGPLRSGWEISWDVTSEQNRAFAGIVSAVCERITNHCLQSDLKLSFGKPIGYVTDDGVVIRGDIMCVAEKKIFVHFDMDAGHLSGSKYQWIQIPNDHICPPPMLCLVH